MARRDHAAPQGLDPVHPVAETCCRIFPELAKLLPPIAGVPVVAFVAMGFFMPEGGLPIVAAACAAESARLVGLLGDRGCIGLHVEFQLEMADPAGMSSPVEPVREGGRLDPLLGRGPV